MPTTASDLTAGQIAMVGTARYTMQHNSVCANLFNRKNLGPGEKSLFIPKFGTVIASDLTDGIDMTEEQALTITGTTHTTDEAGCKVIVTKKLHAQLKEDVFRAVGKAIGDAIKKNIDQDGLTLFSGLSAGVGTAGTTFSQDYLRASVALLFGAAEPAPLPHYAVITPYFYDEIVNDLGTPSTNNVPPDVQKEFLTYYWRGNDKLWGTPIFVTGNITTDTADDSYGATFSKLAFIYLVGWEPETWNEFDGSLRGWEIGVVADYAMVEEDDGYGRYLLFDNTAPTA